ncbi:MAG: AMP-binding protein [Gammaproteobacteria bacterium]
MFKSSNRVESEKDMAAALDSCSFSNLVETAASHYGRHPAFSDRSGGAWQSIDFLAVRRHSFALAHWLMEQGLNGRCMILSESRIEWPLTFFGITCAGGVAVPVDAKSTAAELATFLTCTNPGVLLVSPRLRKLAAEAGSAANWSGTLLVMDIHSTESDSLGGLPAAPAQVQWPAHHPHQTAVIAFTSATSGQPKAVQTSAGNLFHQMQSLKNLFNSKPGDAFLSLLPLNHLLELSCGFLTVFCCGAHVNFLNSILPHEIKDALKQRDITHMIVVPLLMEMIRKGIERNFQNRLGAQGKTLLQALQTASSLSPSHQVRRFLNRFILNELGPRLNTVIVGGATLDASTVNFFSNIGINACQGYGLTETSPVATVNPPYRIRKGSVGKPLPGCKVRIDRQPGERIGEILVKGPCIMNGYLDDPDLTRAVMDERGWFRTGDLGYLDSQGYLFITGRKKNLIVLEGGKKVYPEEVEKALSASLLFQELCVTAIKVDHPSFAGRKTEQVCAVIVPQPTLLAEHDSAALQALCEAEVQRLTADLSAYKRPTRIIVQSAELPKTRTGKVKAPLVQQQLANHFS